MTIQQVVQEVAMFMLNQLIKIQKIKQQ